jgi:hypothetical protein
MGIRIHKKMGYSLSLKEIQEKVCEPNLDLITGNYDNLDHKNAIPSCTYSVMLMLKYTKLVPEDKLADVIMLFRPTIYSYWS